MPGAIRSEIGRASFVVALLLARAGVALAGGGAAGAPAGTATAGRFTVGVEALALWLDRSPVPIPLVTDGLLGAAGTNVLLGNASLDTGSHGGFRLTAAYAASETFSVEASGFSASSRTTSRGASSPGTLGSKDLLLSYFDVTTGAEGYSQLSFSPLWQGSALEEVTNSLLGAELNGAWATTCEGPARLDFLGGLRYLRLRETFRFTTSSAYLPPEPVDVWQTSDELDATNDFYGAQAGVRARYDKGAFFGAASVKVAIGAMAQSLRVDGWLVTNDFTSYGASQTFAGGYFALPSNMGTHSRTTFAVVPELAVDLGVRIGSSLSLSVGYTLLYASNVLRPGEQIDRNVNTTQSTAYTYDPNPVLAGPARPAAGLAGTSLLAQSVRAGVSFRF